MLLLIEVKMISMMHICRVADMLLFVFGLKVLLNIYEWVIQPGLGVYFNRFFNLFDHERALPSCEGNKAYFREF